MRMTIAPLFASLALAASAQAATYTLDPAHTYPQFEIRHLAFSTLHGQFNQTAGKITMDREKNLGAVEAVIQVGSVDTGMPKRDADLVAAPFFDAANHPTMTYKSTKVSYQGKDKATVEGNLTLRGVTKPLTLHVTRISCGMNPILKKPVCGFDAWAQVKRSDFGMTAYVPAIPDEVKLIINSDAVEDSAAP
jgi:polyisoprenoid-binding protein YceI